jgi:hypothetical protein
MGIKRAVRDWREGRRTRQGEIRLKIERLGWSIYNGSKSTIILACHDLFGFHYIFSLC